MHAGATCASALPPMARPACSPCLPAGGAIFKGLQRLAGTVLAGSLGVGTQCKGGGWMSGCKGGLVTTSVFAAGTSKMRLEVDAAHDCQPGPTPADAVYLINGLSYANSVLKFAAMTVRASRASCRSCRVLVCRDMPGYRGPLCASSLKGGAACSMQVLVGLLSGLLTAVGVRFPKYACERGGADRAAVGLPLPPGAGEVVPCMRAVGDYRPSAMLTTLSAPSAHPRRPPSDLFIIGTVILALTALPGYETDQPMPSVALWRVVATSCVPVHLRWPLSSRPSAPPPEHCLLPGCSTFYSPPLTLLAMLAMLMPQVRRRRGGVLS